MPKGIRLGENCLKIGSGATPRGGKEAYLANGPFSFIRSQNVHNSGFVHEGLAFISEAQASKLKNVEVEPDDILVNITGDSVARVCQVDPKVLPGRVNQHVAIVRPDRSKIDPAYLRYWFIAPRSQQHLLSLASAGATRNALTKSMLEGLLIPGFDLNYQNAIGVTLAKLDEKIELNRQMSATLEAMAQIIFRDWFVDFGPVRRKMGGVSDSVAILGGVVTDPKQADRFAATFPDSLGEDGLPKAWSLGSLGDLAKTVGSTVDPSTLPGNTPYIGLEHMPRRSMMLDRWGAADEVSSAKASFGRKNILFGKLRPYFHKVGIAAVDGVCSTDIVVLDARIPIDHALLAACVSGTDFVAFTNQDADGTKMPRTSWAKMKRFPIAIPDVSVRESFQAIVGPWFERVIASVSENRALSETRDYLLPRLMSGKVHVIEAEGAAK